MLGVKIGLPSRITVSRVESAQIHGLDSERASTGQYAQATHRSLPK